MMEPNDQAIETYQEQIKPLANALQHTSDLLGSIEQPLGELYNQAEAANDEAMRNNVMAVWQQSQQLAEQLPPFVAALTAGSAALETTRDQRNQFARELSTLVDAIESFNTNDPRLASFAEILEADVMEYAAEMMYEDAMEMAEEAYCDAIDNQFHEFLMTNFDTSHIAIGRLLDCLRDDDTTGLDETQCQIIQSLLDTFKLEVLSDVNR